ncbi:MAG TPA: cell division topological specificity factor MinE [Candidatus Baltobacteraceae bacterium]
MIEFFNKLFGREASSSTAKERLRLVLMSDHLSLAPDMVEAMKRDLVDVISKYVQVDRTKIEVSFEQQDKALAMLANIPIVGVNRDAGGPRGGSGNGAPAASSAPTANPSAQASAPENPAPPQPAVPTPRRRRRKKANPAAAT